MDCPLRLRRRLASSRRGHNPAADIDQALDDAAGDEWLINVEDLCNDLPAPVLPEAVLALLMESGVWRDIGEGWLVRWDGPIQAKAERVLALVGRPMTPAELVEAIGYGSEGTLKNKPRSLVRVDKQFHLALPEWGHEEYEGITTEIKQRIERGGGVASRAAMVEEFTVNFRVSASSVLTYLNLPIFDVDDDAVRLANALRFTPQPPSTVAGAVRTQHGWGGRLIVTEDITKGYSFTVSPHTRLGERHPPRGPFASPSERLTRTHGEHNLANDEPQRGC